MYLCFIRNLNFNLNFNSKDRPKVIMIKKYIFVSHRELHEGTLKDNGLIDESKIILIPNVETGLLVST